MHEISTGDFIALVGKENKQILSNRKHLTEMNVTFSIYTHIFRQFII